MSTEFVIQRDKPLFPDLIWSRPETKLGAGKLLIIGGQAQEFAGVAESFAAADNAGAGVIRVLMPESTRKVTKMLPNIEYAPSNQSGSFSAQAFTELLEASLWADAVLLAGDLGKNSETALMLEKFIREYSGSLILAGGVLASINMPARELFNMQDILLSLNFNEMQKCVAELGIEKPLTSDSTNSQITEILKDITEKYAASLLIVSSDSIWSADSSKCALTDKSKSNNKLAAQAAVWAMQNPTKKFEAITTAAYI